MRYLRSLVSLPMWNQAEGWTQSLYSSTVAQLTL